MTQPIQDPLDPRRWMIASVTEPVFGASAGTGVLGNVHLSAKCKGEFCVIHNPSEHHMRSWPLEWRGDKGVFERRCPHGIGHPDPDDAAFLKRVGRGSWTTHGCDGCC